MQMARIITGTRTVRLAAVFFGFAWLLINAVISSQADTKHLFDDYEFIIAIKNVGNMLVL